MKTLYESILKGMDKIISEGDDMIAKANAELNDIRKYADNKNHKLWHSSKFGYDNSRKYEEEFDARALAEALGYSDKINTLRVLITKNNDIQKWRIDLTFNNGGYSFDTRIWQIARLSVPLSEIKGFPALLKKYVAPIFDDIETLREFMTDNKCLR